MFKCKENQQYKTIAAGKINAFNGLTKACLPHIYRLSY
jgi:hypothetical protein